MNQKNIINLAKAKARKIKKLREDPRYIRVIGRLQHEKLLEASHHIPQNKRKLYLNDTLWVGENIEPRVLELIPALAIKRPSIFIEKEYPQDLKNAVSNIKRCNVKNKAFKSIPLKKCLKWIPFVGRKGKVPSTAKNFRFESEDLIRLKEISNKLNLTETAALKKSLEHFYKHISNN